ncbi:MAG TPA: TIGR03619 family F420-dependent LLM class oxidoreductase, partial [Acidimicrobiales bacterium]|nr:TIGR03619 family F420-dependent LLM class oxidoreductase [Acidimicrobiales bacterium]
MTPGVGVNLSPVPADELAEAAELAEALGFESVWIGEHVIIPWEWTSAYPYADHPPLRPDFRFYDPFVALAHVGAVTSSILLGTGVVILPLRDPFLTARSMVTADLLSGGRLLLGLGAGWLQEEYDVLGRDFSSRGRRFDEALGVLDVLCTEERPEYHGTHFDLPAAAFEPKPGPHRRPPFLLGGASPAALRRVARHGDGWYGSRHPPSEVAEIVEGLRGLSDGRSLSITVGAVVGATLE